MTPLGWLGHKTSTQTNKQNDMKRFLLLHLCALRLLSAQLVWKWKYIKSRMSGLIILSYIAVYDRDTISNVGMSFVMLIINQHLHLEIVVRKFFNNGNGKYWNLRLVNSLNVTENDSANSVCIYGQKWLDWLAIFSFLIPGYVDTLSHLKLWLNST